MMQHAINDSGLEIVPHRGITRGGVKYPPSIFTIWDRAAKLAIGIYEVIPDEIPAGKRATDWALAMDTSGDFARKVPTLVDYDPVSEWRENATVPRVNFVNAARASGLIADADAVAAAQGNIPATMAAAFAGAPAATQVDVAVQWAAAADVRRGSAFIEAIRVAMGLTQEQVDALFGGYPE